MNVDRIAHAYYGDLTHPSTLRCRRRIHWMCEQVIGQRVLDIGCSEGIVGLILAREGFSYTGVDLEDGALAYARQEAAKESDLVRSRLRYEIADATALPFDDNSFDTVLIGEVLEHLTHPKRVLLEARRVLAAGGRIAVTVPLGLTHEHADHKRTFYPSSLARLAEPFFDAISVDVRDAYVMYTGARRPSDAQGDGARPAGGTALGVEPLEEYCGSVEAERARLRISVRDLKAASKDARQRLTLIDALETQLRDAEATAAGEQAARSRAEQTANRLEASLREKEQQHLAALRELDETYAKKLREQERLARASQARQGEGVERLRDFAAVSSPRGATILVVSKGDEQLVTLRGRTGLHFPQGPDGDYAGFHPLDSAWAIDHLEQLRRRGADHLLLPAAAFWWLTHYAEFREHLSSSSVPVAFDQDVGLLLRLSRRDPSDPAALPEDVIAHAAAAFGTARPENTPTPAKARPSLVSAAAVLEPPRRRDGAEPVTAGVILDRFTTSCLQPEARLVTFRPDNWRETLEANRPDVLFVESAWQGNDGAWKYRVASYESNMGDELLDLVKWARRRDIPTVFWNKEDPVHFDRFLTRGAEFDVVFTTDANCVPRYRDAFGHDRVFDLPFAAQPLLHNPIQSESRSGSVCFAGTYYGNRHDERRRDLTHILTPALRFGLDIYDRQTGVGISDKDSYRFPPEYAGAIRGRLEYDEMVKVYKRYRVFLNVNSVKDSPTMFSRRVFELLACGTPVVSSYARGLVALLGDTVYISESEHDTQRHLEGLLNDEEAWARASVRGIRRVLGEHTYRRRLASVWERIGLGGQAERPLSISVVALVRSPEGARILAEALRAQTLQPRDVVLMSDGALPPAVLDAFRSQLPASAIHQAQRDGGEWKGCVEPAVGDAIAFLDDRDHYGPDYLRDHALALEYSSHDFVGKQTFQRRTGRARLKRVAAGAEFRATRSVPSATLVVRRHACSPDVLHQALASRTFSRPDDDVLSIDWFNYVQDAHLAYGAAAPLDARLRAAVEA